MQHVSSTVLAVRDDCIAQPPQLELIGHSIVSLLYLITAICLLPSVLIAHQYGKIVLCLKVENLPAFLIFLHIFCRHVPQILTRIHIMQE